MMMRKHFSVLQGTGAAALSLIALLGLSSCGDDEKAAKDETAAAAASAPEPEPAAPSTAKQDALFQDLLYKMGKSFTANAANPEWTEMVRNHLVLLQEYYEEMAPTQVGTMARTKLAVRIGEVFNELNSFVKSEEAFNKASADFDAMSETDRNSADGNRLMSAIQTGLGADLLSQGKSAEALPHYEKALEADLRTLASLLPEDKMPLRGNEVEPDIAAAVSEVISSYCCLAHCQRVADDPEEARETVKKCQDLVTKIDKLSMPMSLRYARLMTLLGDLESSCGNLKEALTAWVSAARVCEQVYKQSGQENLRVEAQNRFRQLALAVRAAQEQIGEPPAEDAPTELSEEGNPAEGAAPATSDRE